MEKIECLPMCAKFGCEEKVVFCFCCGNIPLAFSCKETTHLKEIGYGTRHLGEHRMLTTAEEFFERSKYSIKRNK